MGRESTQECFDTYVFEFVEDLLYNMPKDDDYPDRAYLYGSSSFDNSPFSFRMKIPAGLAGEQVLLQWVYWTANSCNPEGYHEYFDKNNTPEHPEYGLAYNGVIPDCEADDAYPLAPLPNPNLPGTTPERFINCAEVTITGEPSTPTNPPFDEEEEEEEPVSEPVSNNNPTVVGTCGGGSRGNGICPDQSMCCSEWGYCGTEETGHCDGSTPVTSAPSVAPVTPSTPTGDNDNDGHGDGDSRMIAYLGNWHSCPTDEQLAQYTHIVIAFAVSYTWSPSKNICSETCEISDPLVCDNSPQPELIKKWKDAGKKVILSFGGAGMGGSWDGDVNDCWDYCFGREDQVVQRLTEIVEDMDLDGVDIDYEYFYEDNQYGSGFNKGAEAQKFLEDVTVGLRSSMKAGAELTHAPMEPDVVPGTAYFDVLKKVASHLDFLMPQYYNGFVRSYDDFDGALSHFATLADDVFGGDAAKVVFGFCINDCPGFNLSGDEAASVMGDLGEHYPCNGGAFFWVVNDDTDGAWSGTVNTGLQWNTDQCGSGSSSDEEPEPEEEEEPACEDDPKLKYKGKKKRDCDWVGKKANKRCKKNWEGKKLKDYCPVACGKC